MNLTHLLPVLLLAGGTPRPPLTCTVSPRVIEAGAFYNGASVRIQGTAAYGSKVIVTIAGRDGAERFGRKAQIGPIWLNAGKVRISGAPSLFLRFSPAPVTSLLSQDAIVRQRLDEKSLMARIRIEPPSADYRDDVATRNSYLALRKGEGTYSFGNRGIVMGDAGQCASYALDLRWPKLAPPMIYEVRVYEVVQGAVARETSADLSVVRTGFPAWLAGMAANRASLYGVVSVLIGALAGFGIDRLTTLLFRRKRFIPH
jgi:hypothetical protein